MIAWYRMSMPYESDGFDHHGHFLPDAWEPPVRLHRAGREVRSATSYRCRADTAGAPSRLLVQRCEAGLGAVIIGGRRHAVAPGRALVVAIPGRAVWTCAGDGIPWRFSFASVTCPSPPEPPEPVIDLPEGGALERVFSALVARRLAGDPGAQPVLAYQLLLGIAGLGAERPAGAEARLAERLAASGGRGRIAALARTVGASHAALTRRFARRFGEPPRAWAERLRLRTACARLAAGEPPARAGEAAGYADPAHFGRAFRRRLGVTPGAWAALADSVRPWP